MSHDEAVLLERELIQKYRTKDPKYGYNQTDGGEGLFGYSVSEETRRKQSERRQGLNAPGFNKHPDEAVRAKMSGSNKNRSFNQDTRQKMSKQKQRQVYQYSLAGELIAVFPSVSDVNKILGVNIGNVCACARYTIPTAAGFFWSYKPIEDPQIIVDHVTGIKPLPQLKGLHLKPVVQLTHT